MPLLWTTERAESRKDPPMASIQIQRIKSAWKKLFDSHIDMSDYQNKPEQEKEKAFLSRAVASYALMLLCTVDEDVAGAALTDGFDDGGIDLIHFDKEDRVLYIGQSKWIESGDGSLSQADCQKLFNGCRDVVSLRLQHFNAAVQARESDLKLAVESTDVSIVVYAAYSGTQPLSQHVQNEIDKFLTEMNDTGEVFTFQSFGQAELYQGITSHAQRHSIDLEIMLHEWGYVKEPHPAYYGQVQAACIAQWWKEHGRSLFARNIRSFRGSTDVNESIAATLNDEPEHFWYFNNGITILCNRIAKQLVGGSARESGVFECQGVNVVNGAQTVGMIGATSQSLSSP